MRNSRLPSRLRFDRVISLRLVQPVSRLLQGRRRQARIPILMYHGIQSAVRADHPYFETNISPALFARHMELLSSHRYKAVSLREANEVLLSGGDTRHQVVLTFDDGYRDFYTEAFPVLLKYGLKATVFVVPGLTGEQRIGRNGKEFMTWAEIREVQSNGMQIGSHTMTHPTLHSMPPPSIGEELQQSKARIEDKLGVAVQSFAYPFAFPEQDRPFIRMMKELLQAYGYRDGVCTIIGTAQRGHDPLFLPRLPVNAYDDLPFLQAKLNGSYDWLHAFQYLRKRMKAVV
jgi:peptidoglycan/xylan/chitin deacetylase (PgdA/CDA1 family)